MQDYDAYNAKPLQALTIPAQTVLKSGMKHHNIYVILAKTIINTTCSLTEPSDLISLMNITELPQCNKNKRHLSHTSTWNLFSF